MSRLVSDNTVHVYQSVIDDVIARVKPEFCQEGVDESVLDELRALWEAKLVQTGVLGDVNQAEAAQVLGSVGQAPRPGAMMQFRQGPQMPPQVAHHQQFSQYQQQVQQGMTQLVQPQQRYAVPPSMPAATAAYAAAAAAAAGTAGVMGEDRKRKLEEAGLVGASPVKREQLGPAQGATTGYGSLPPGVLPRPGIPQQDGPADEGEGGVDEEAGEPDEELNENDDLAAVDDEEVDEEQLKDVVLGQFDKVSRTKARWKVQLKDCIITANGRDYLVHKANGEMNF